MTSQRSRDDILARVRVGLALDPALVDTGGEWRSTTSVRRPRIRVHSL